MKKIKIDGAKLQLRKQQIVALNVAESAHVMGGANITDDSEICPSTPIKLSDGCPIQPGSAWCPISDPTPSRPGG